MRRRAWIDWPLTAAMAWLALAGAAGANCRPSAPIPTSFADWRTQFLQRAVEEGRNGQVAYDLVGAIEPDQRVLDRIYRPRSEESAGFSLPIHDYLAIQLTPHRLENGRQALIDHREALARVSGRTGVPVTALVAIWGMETRYGHATLDFRAPQALATLAYAHNRRRCYFERELLAVVQLVEEKRVRPDQLASSFDGGLGQPQFMPTNYLMRAVDGDADGQVDLWSSHADMFASIGAYLAVEGWRPGEFVMQEVLVADALPRSIRKKSMTVAGWSAVNVRRADGRPWSQNDLYAEAELYQPAGDRGPVFLITRNFKALWRYNGAKRYGLTAALLMDALEGKPGPRVPWPRPEDALDAEGLKQLQAALIRLGHDLGSPDGLYGERTYSAMNAFLASRGLSRIEYPTNALLRLVQAVAPAP